jgi:hypothetical protein
VAFSSGLSARFFALSVGNTPTYLRAKRSENRAKGQGYHK